MQCAGVEAGGLGWKYEAAMQGNTKSLRQVGDKCVVKCTRNGQRPRMTDRRVKQEKKKQGAARTNEKAHLGDK